MSHQLQWLSYAPTKVATLQTAPFCWPWWAWDDDGDDHDNGGLDIGQGNGDGGDDDGDDHDDGGVDDDKGGGDGGGDDRGIGERCEVSQSQSYIGVFIKCIGYCRITFALALLIHKDKTVDYSVVSKH